METRKHALMLLQLVCQLSSKLWVTTNSSLELNQSSPTSSSSKFFNHSSIILKAKSSRISQPLTPTTRISKNYQVSKNTLPTQPALMLHIPSITSWQRSMEHKVSEIQKIRIYPIIQIFD